MLSHMYAIIPSIPRTVYPYIGFISIAIGLLLAFAGEEMWKILTSLIGVILGASLGLAFGTAFAGFVGGLILGLIGAIVGGILFYYIAEIGISLLIAYFAMVGTLILLGIKGGVLGRSAQSSTVPFIVALVVGLAVFVICIIYFKDLIVVFTAVAGGILVDYGLTVFRVGQLSTLIAFAIIVIGVFFQFIRISRKKQGMVRQIEAAPPE
ncbi:MAG: hypothetical protein KIY12_01880 [Thermoplasmata archaeon]|uniref:DUF4203 domain-containing protein n=1 Tax=Candidatus Sysuiplasma superficiale TaxID=2823368 RepID=A0A8J8CFQ7_9ARCH|nr:hypothetical protein [Candidatus Sysuiplasma superficiale]MBX8643467.1 hypothetical protein [Candidatus Sysuiplasma superficiale]MCL4346672.1 hypothetical protein [Candidatus Thermoplasmatota archaeon]